MQKSGFVFSKEQRKDFYEFIERTFNQLGRRLDFLEMNFRELRRDVNDMKGGFFGHYETDNINLRLQDYFPQASILRSYQITRLDQVIDQQLAHKIYRPLALSTALASGVLAISLAVVATPILATPFALTTLFSLYYWHLQGKKG